MKLIVIHQNKNSPVNDARCTAQQGPTISEPSKLLRLAFCSEPFSGITVSCLNGDAHHRSNSGVIAMPQSWAPHTQTTYTESLRRKFAKKAESNIIYYRDSLPVSVLAAKSSKPNAWFIISNGRFAAKIDLQRLYKMLGRLRADVIAVNLLAHLQAANEKAIITTQGDLVGFRRFYDNLIQPAPMPADWPHYLFIKTDVLSRLLVNGALPLAFSSFIDECSSNSLTLRSLNIGGTVLDLGTEEGLLAFLVAGLNSPGWNYPDQNRKSHKQLPDESGVTISPDARLFGKVLFGRNVSVARNAIIIGPAIIGDDVKIKTGAVIRTSVIRSGISITKNQFVQNRVLISQRPKHQITGSRARQQRHSKKSGPIRKAYSLPDKDTVITCNNSRINNFRTWPKFSYARCFKRIADLVAAVVVLILFVPITPFIALAIALNSPGTVFFRDKRQGLQGKTFNCLKFRTMLAGADKLQDKLRSINQVDGPQFRIENDPRTSAVGRFLRGTHIDEIPQFVNVLLGQMSVVGPRPSPEAENTLCPSWRDARLSVRPGITGLWQVCRTREPTKDFQEWIYYDIEYVRNLSLKIDLWLCWKTVKKLIQNFIGQF